MRTLKKVLALSLVFAMAFTMMAGAAFKDQNKIDSSLNNDIQLLTALGVFKGDENGNFNPTANVKRSEAAKMIYVLKNNGVDDGAVAFQGVSKYADVPVGHWAEGYINYCTNLGYMGGWKEGNVQKFDPNGNVTGVELTKMLLCMIGYKADIQGYTGNGWQTNVLVDAATSGLSANFIPSIYGATPRQWTARLMTNALDAEWVTYSKGELTYKGNTYAEQFLNLRTAEGILTDTNSNKLGTSADSISSSLNESDKVTVTLYAAVGGNTTITAVGDADDSLLGQPVKMYYKHAGTTSEAKLYAVLPYAKNHKVVNTTIDAIKYDSKVKTTVTIDGLGKMDYTNSTVTGKKINLYMNNVLVKNDTIDQLATYLDCNDSRAVTVVANKDGYAETILVDDLTAFAKVKKIDAAKNTLTLEKASVASFLTGSSLEDASGTSLTFDNSSAQKDNFNKYLNVASDVKNGSVVKITANTSTGKLVYDITLADKVEGTPTGYTLDGANYATLTINGTAYKMVGGNNQLQGYDWATATNTSLLSDKTFYTDGKYVVFSEGGVTSASVENLAYITAVDTVTSWGKNSYKVKALLSDGTVGEYEVAAVYDEAGVKVAEKTTVDTTMVNSVYTGTQYSVVKSDADLQSATRYNSDTTVTGILEDMFKAGNAKDKVFSYTISDGKITLKALVSDTVATGVKFDKGVQDYKHETKTIVVDGATSYVVDPNAYFFVKSTANGTKYSVVKASELLKDQDSTDTDSIVDNFGYKTVNGIKTLLFGSLELKTSVVASAADYAYANESARYDLIDGKHTVQMVVTSAAGEPVTIKKVFDDQASAKAAVDAWNKLKGKVVKYDLNAKGNVEGDPAVITNINATTSVVADKWNKLVVSGWSSTTAEVKCDTGTAGLVNVASDVKIHYVDVTGTTPNFAAKLVSDGEVKIDSTKTSALAYVQKVNGVDTITDIFVEVNGDDISFIAQ